MPALLDLDDPRCAEGGIAGGKAAALSVARASGLPVLPGLVVTAPASRGHMQLGVQALARRGSGGARLEVSAASLDDDLIETLLKEARALGDVLVVRSSSVLEAATEWSGAFTSYLDIRPEEVGQAVRGCWASAFGVATLDRYAAAGIEPGSADMAVLIQPAAQPKFGGTARLEGGEMVITAVAGSPAPLVQGWEPGARARLSAEGKASGPAIDLMGGELVAEVTNLLRQAHSSMGSTGCEWVVVDDEIVLLQLTQTIPAARPPVRVNSTALPAGPAGEIGRLVRRYPGPLGEALVLPWALGDPASFLDPVGPLGASPSDAFREAIEQAAELTAEVWSRRPRDAADAARQALASLRGPDPSWDELTRLSRPDPERATGVLARLATVRAALAEAGAVTWPEVGWHFEPDEIGEILAGKPAIKRPRIGYDRWEPFDAAVVMAEGTPAHGTPAAPGIGRGKLCWIGGPEDLTDFRPRDVVVAPYPTPYLAALLWDAAGVATIGGGPAAHLFESARALAIPAICGVRLEEALGTSPDEASGAFALALDGSSGTLYVTDW